MTPNENYKVEVQFVAGKWVKNSPQGPYATREEILMTLENVQEILIRAQMTYYPIDVSITDLQIDTSTFQDFGMGISNLVEECICPKGYFGLSCENCAPGFERVQDGVWKGKCREISIPISCPPGYFGDPSRGIQCQQCRCPLTEQSNQ